MNTPFPAGGPPDIWSLQEVYAAVSDEAATRYVRGRFRWASREDAQDIIQLNKLNLERWVRAGASKSFSAAATYHTSLHRTALNYLRSESIRKKAETVAGAIAAAQKNAEDSDAYSTPEEVAKAIECANRLLPPAQRDAVVMRINGHAYADIAEALGRTVANVRQLIHRAVPVLAAELGEQ